MLHHPIYLEDYIVCLCELSDIATPGVTVETMVRLSKFDRNPIRKIANQVKYRRIGLTLKQVDFVKLLLNKYRKQLTARRIKLDDLDQVPLLFAIRTVEHRRNLTLKDGMLCLEFNFNTEIIKEINEFDHQGRCYWLSDQHRWEVYPSEANLKFIMDVATKHHFFIADEVCNLHEQLAQFTQQHTAKEFRIELQLDGTIKNAPTELLEHLAEKNITSLLQLCDNACVYKYDISSEVSRMVFNSQEHRKVAHQTAMWGAICGRTAFITFPDYIELAKEYCKLTGRGPIILALTCKPTDEILSLTLPLSAITVQDAVYYVDIKAVACSFLNAASRWVCDLPKSDALIITDTDQQDWYYLFRSLNKIWYVDKQGA